jgi:hypothetical protein
MKNRALLRSLDTRGETAATLARRIQSSRSHVSQVLANKTGIGGHTRRKLAPLLTAEERALAGWDERGDLICSKPVGPSPDATPHGFGKPALPLVPQGT